MSFQGFQQSDERKQKHENEAKWPFSEFQDEENGKFMPYIQMRVHSE